MTTKLRSWAFGALVLAAASLGAACDDGNASCDQASRPHCIDDRGGGECSDTSKAALCSNGQWSCPAGTLREEDCVCLGPPPAVGCTCAATGWSCP